MCGCIPPAPPPPAPPPAPPLCQPPSFTHHLSHTISHTHLCQPPSFTHHLSHAIFTHFVNHHLSYTISHTPPLLCLYLWLKMQNSCGAFTGCFLVCFVGFCVGNNIQMLYTHIYIYMRSTLPAEKYVGLNTHTFLGGGISTHHMFGT